MERSDAAERARAKVISARLPEIEVLIYALVAPEWLRRSGGATAGALWIGTSRRTLEAFQPLMRGGLV